MNVRIPMHGLRWNYCGLYCQSTGLSSSTVCIVFWWCTKKKKKVVKYEIANHKNRNLVSTHEKHDKFLSTFKTHKTGMGMHRFMLWHQHFLKHNFFLFAPKYLKRSFKISLPWRMVSKSFIFSDQKLIFIWNGGPNAEKELHFEKYPYTVCTSGLDLNKW